MTFTTFKTQFAKKYSDCYKIKLLLTRKIPQFNIHYLSVQNQTGVIAVIQLTEKPNEGVKLFKYSPVSDFASDIRYLINRINSIIDQ